MANGPSKAAGLQFAFVTKVVRNEAGTYRKPKDCLRPSTRPQTIGNLERELPHAAKKTGIRGEKYANLGYDDTRT